MKKLFFAALLATCSIVQPASAAKGQADTYYYLVFSDPAPGEEAEYNRWYDHQHAPDVVAVPGFVTAQRFVLAGAQMRETPAPSKYLVVYKVVTDDLASVIAEVNRRLQTKMTLISPAFKGARNSPGGYYKAISPIVEHKGAAAAKGDTYYQFDFSNGFEKQYIADRVAMPGFVTGVEGELSDARERPGQTSYRYLAMFQIVPSQLPAGSKTSGHVGFTYKTWGPLHSGDQVRAERAKSSKD